jgi:hypothetical protein
MSIQLPGLQTMRNLGTCLDTTVPDLIDDADALSGKPSSGLQNSVTIH